MSKIYSAGQYDQVFDSKRLQMYEVPKPELAERPNQRKKDVSFIANEKGHLLPGVGRSSTNPFGDYVGTWDLPKSIPGPYHLVTTGRTNKNIEKINHKKLETDAAILAAKEQQKPLALQRE